jgi:outer membrane protein OmpA-like peptidoglycan-associated protein
VVLVMVGYADKQGDQTKNRGISRSRAEAVVRALKDKLSPVNIMHAVGLGGQDLFGGTLDKNRVVEIWAVQP